MKPTRRDFLAATALATLQSCTTYPLYPRNTPSIALAADPHDPLIATPPAQWALAHLHQTLESRNIPVRRISHPADARPSEFCIHAATKKHDAESFALTPSPRLLLATAADPPGLVYAITELADRIENRPNPLHLDAPVVGRPANKIRSILRLFVSELEDKPWFYDRDFWQRYLTMLVTHRFNRINLSLGLGYDFARGITDAYFYFAYPFLVSPPGYHVRAVTHGGVPLSNDEREHNLETLRFISDEAAARGLHFQLGIWTHSYQWTNSPNATFTIEGLDAKTQAPYSRDALHAILEACPSIRGITLRTHGESGVPEGSYDIWKTIMSGTTGLKNADGSPRTVELDLHAKSITEEMIATARGTGMPVTISPKFTAEHMGLPYMQASIRPQEAPRRDAGGLMSLSNGSRNFLRYSYGDLLRVDRDYQVITRVWPGTQRLLLWADPLYAAEYGKIWSFCGMDGVEYCDPLTFKGRQGSGKEPAVAGAGRSAYRDESLVPAGGDWQKYLTQYRLLGRLSYDPDAPPENWQPWLQSEFGSAAVAVESALANASRILPMITTAHLPAAANLAYWPEIYVNMSLYDASSVGSYRESPNPKIFENVTAADPQLFASVSEYVEVLLGSKPMAKVTPLEVAVQLEAWSQDAEQALGNLTADAGNVRRVTVDVAIAAGTGQFFAEKLRAAVAFAVFDRTGHVAARAQAVTHYQKAREAWAGFLELADGAYVADITFGPGRHLRGDWHERLGDIDRDIAGLPKQAGNRRGDVSEQAIAAAMEAIKNATRRSAADARHKGQRFFRWGRDIEVAVTASESARGGRLWYRHVNQGENWRFTSMARASQSGGQLWMATIPAEYTKTVFPVQYYFEIEAADRGVTIYPGFAENFTGQPYFVTTPMAIPARDG